MSEEQKIDIDILEEITNGEEQEAKVSLSRKLTLSQQKEYEESHWYHKYRIEAIKKIIKNNIVGENLKILDIGVGTGTLSRELEKYGEVTHIDISNEVVEFNNDLVIKKENYPWESAKTLENNYFDYIVFFNTLEYIDNLKWTLDISKSKLKKDGKILITTIVGKELTKEDNVYEIKRRFDYDSLKELGLSVGLKVDSSTYFEGTYGNEFVKSINFLFDETVYSNNIIPKDNNLRFDFYMQNEYKKLCKETLMNGKQIFVSFEYLTEEEQKELNEKYMKNEKKVNFIDKKLNELVYKRNEKEEEKELIKSGKAFK